MRRSDKADSTAPTRRTLLTGALATGITGGLLRRPARAASRKRIVVLGAGMSGLTAALALHRRGHDVTIVEYQDRIGGRLLSEPLSGGQFTEAGGGHFRANMPYVLGLIRQFGLPVLSLNDGQPRYLIDGKTADSANLANWPWDLTTEERNVSVASNLYRYLYRCGVDSRTVLDDRWAHGGHLARFDEVTVGTLIRQVGASDAFCNLLEAHAGTGTCAAPALQMLPRFAYHFGQKALFRIAGGNQRLPLAMADALGRDRIVLNAPVIAIDDDGPHCRVATRGGRELLADAVVSSIPFSVLGDVRMASGWSAPKRRVFAEMGWGNTVKIIVQTRTPSWLSRNVHGWPMAGTDRAWERVIDITGNEPGGMGNTFFYLNDRNAAAVLKMPAGQRAQPVIDQFRADMPDLFDGVVEAKEFAWTEQPWIKGSVGGLPIGGGWMLDEAARPEGRVHLAGDFTTMKTGWVEGAIESGLRAARQIDPGAEADFRQGSGTTDL